jgi:hypothetical protein
VFWWERNPLSAGRGVFIFIPLVFFLAALGVGLVEFTSKKTK